MRSMDEAEVESMLEKMRRRLMKEYIKPKKGRVTCRYSILR